MTLVIDNYFLSSWEKLRKIAQIFIGELEVISLRTSENLRIF